MPRVLHRELRFQVIDHCLRDSHVRHNIHTITEACNQMLHESYGICVSRRTVQYDLSILRRPPFSIELDLGLLRQGIYRYADVACKVPYLMETEAYATSHETIMCTVAVDNNALAHFEDMVFAMSPFATVMKPAQLRRKMQSRLSSAIKQYGGIHQES